MLLDWMRRWRDGRTICEHPTCKPTHFYYIVADRGQTSDAFYNKLGYREGVTFYSVVSADSGQNVDDYAKDAHGKALFDHVMLTLNPEPGSHVVIDPLAPLFIAGNQNRTRDVASSLIRMSRTIEERRINITGTWHFAKQKDGKAERYKRPQDRISGSGAISGFSDTQIYLVDPEPPQIPYHTLGWNPREVPPEEFKFERQQWFIPYVGLEGIGEDDEDDFDRVNAQQRSLNDLYRYIVNLGTDGCTSPALCSMVQRDLKMSKTTYYRLLRQLQHTDKIEIDALGIIRAKIRA
jgi:hypothetical protein